MRDFKGMKRQRGRNRSGGGGSGGRPQHNTNRAFDSNGPDNVKVRGAAQHVYEKYQQFARDAHTAGDRVLAENYLQHAEHYFRVMRAMQPLRPLSEIIGRDNFVSGYDIDFEDESGAQEAQDGDGEGDRQDRPENRGEERPREDYRPAEPRPQDDRPRFERNGGERFQNDRPRDDRPIEERARDDRPKDDRPRDDRPRDDRQRDDRGGRGFRDDRPRFNRDDRPARFERSDGSETQNDRVTEARSNPIPDGALSAEPASVLRADDGDFSHAPAFLQVRPAEPRDDASGEARRPRRRRNARPTDGAEETPAPAEPSEEA